MFYRVRVIVSASNPKQPQEKYAKSYYEGIFFSKQEKVTQAQIEKDVTDYIIKQLMNNNKHLRLTAKISKYEQIDKDFFVGDSRDQ